VPGRAADRRAAARRRRAPSRGARRARRSPSCRAASAVSARSAPSGLIPFADRVSGAQREVDRALLGLRLERDADAGVLEVGVRRSGSRCRASARRRAPPARAGCPRPCPRCGSTTEVAPRPRRAARADADLGEGLDARDDVEPRARPRRRPRPCPPARGAAARASRRAWVRSACPLALRARLLLLRGPLGALGDHVLLRRAGERASSVSAPRRELAASFSSFSVARARPSPCCRAVP
jgi:hypothetical protein